MQQYRADIDGLRAIAVLSVAIFHAEIGFFTGGYIGVDIFFVISGYLITNIIVREIGEGRFSYFKFYERRLRRIAPALIVVLAVVTALTMLLKTPKEARFFGESVTYAVLMISNFFFYQETNYFSAPLDTFALLHTWSLSVEEQFYLLWPPILALLFGYAARWTRVAIITLTALSFLSAAVVVSIDKNAAFFLLPFRMWELSLGALIALGVAPRLSTPWMAEAAAALGLVLILSAAVLFDEQTVFPGVATLAPTLGAALLILAGQSNRTRIGALLSLRPIVFVGLVSYSFYLWHWPALSFARYVVIRPLEAPEALAALLLAFLLSVLSLYFVERPFRRSVAGREVANAPPNMQTAASPIATRKVVAGALVAFLLISGAGVFLQKTKGWPERLEAYAPLFAENLNKYGQYLRKCRAVTGLTPDRPDARIGQTFCRFGDRDVEPDFIVWGDSYSMALLPAFFKAATETGRSGLLSTFILCPPLKKTELDFSEHIGGCRAQNAAILAALPQTKVKTAFLVANWNNYYADGWLKGRTEEITTVLRSMGIEPIFVESVPDYPESIPSAVYRMRRFGIPPPFDASRARHDRERRDVAAAFEASGGRILPVSDLFCDAQRCFYEANGVPLYTDTNHVNEVGADRITDRVKSFLGEAASRAR